MNFKSMLIAVPLVLILGFLFRSYKSKQELIEVQEEYIATLKKNKALSDEYITVLEAAVKEREQDIDTLVSTMRLHIKTHHPNL
ncbi:hypothetical protein Q4E40_02715 [Pontibacter sp. BT731]|uniref:hypothetical protein n=1 Tax=Pontibacter coccineus TaxID=3063328 RepID=UPI0026E23610|nr:hypothetical protein [Pontibacter sp. BT731]MDO6389025.1 hypothetical protein [Pontibacter sp. BT731]